MSRKVCKRKVYALINPVSFAIEGVKPPQGPKLDQLRTMELSAIEAFRTGKATLDDWSVAVYMCNITEHMSSNGIGAEAMPDCIEAFRSLTDAAKRYETTRKMGLDGLGLQALREVYSWHDLQRTSVTLSEYEKHILDTTNRVRSKAPEVREICTS